jgi:ketosteroid isomerase-like protein
MPPAIQINSSPPYFPFLSPIKLLRATKKKSAHQFKGKSQLGWKGKAAGSWKIYSSISEGKGQK